MMQILARFVFLWIYLGCAWLSGQTVYRGLPDNGKMVGNAGNDTSGADTLTRVKEHIPIKGILSEEERRFYQADVFPLSLLQRGRLATSAYGGMPPGYFQFAYAGNHFQNPVIGFWNEQWIPHYRIDRRWQESGGMDRQYAPPFLNSNRPLTDIVFSQDFATSLSFLDINFAKRFSPTNFVQLSGSNFLGDGSQPPGFSEFKITTYQGQIYLEFGRRWKADLFYWQIRHRYRLPPEEGTAPDEFKQVIHMPWIRLRGKLSEKDSLVIVPGYKAVEDGYKRQGNNLRENRYKIAHLDLLYSRNLGGFTGGLEGGGRFFTNKGKNFWFKRNETDGRLLGFVRSKTSGFDIRLRGGVFFHSEAGWHGGGSAELSRGFGRQNNLGATVFSLPKILPQLWRTFTHPSIPRYSADHFIQRQGVTAFLKIQLAKTLWLRVEPFAFRTTDYPLLLASETQWQKQSIENTGVRFQAEWDFWKFQLANDVSYHAGYRNAYAPRINNITTMKTSFRLLKNALKVDGVLVWHYIGAFHSIDFSRLLNVYRISDIETGRFNIADFRLQLQFRDAVVFFIWENFLSEDYQIVSGLQETFRIFRLGIDWQLFD